MLCIYIENPAPSRSLGGVELVTSNAEFVNHHIAHIHQIRESLLQHIIHIDVVCEKKTCLVSGSLPLSWEREISRTPSLNTQIHLRFRRMRDRVATEFDGGA